MDPTSWSRSARMALILERAARAAARMRTPRRPGASRRWDSRRLLLPTRAARTPADGLDAQLPAGGLERAGGVVAGFEPDRERRDESGERLVGIGARSLEHDDGPGPVAGLSF